MLPTPITLVFLLSFLSCACSQSLFQLPASPAPNRSVEPGLEQYAPIFGGLQLNATSDSRAQCFTNHPGFPKFYPVYRLDCYYLLYTILIRRGATIPYRWDTTASTLPVVYKYGTCVISIYADSHTSQEVFTELGAARVAAVVVDNCVTPQRNLLGGKHSIGEFNGYWVAVGGQFPIGKP
ncbi:MAG: hypothetical protein LQ341_005111 [Variospora aurantia]|nr:MAG: hypothetical protein LQ341_005111 [Variospora aurantia]